MIIGIIKETTNGEKRVAITPIIAKELTEGGFKCIVEHGAGNLSLYNDIDYKKSGAQLEDKETICKQADIILKVQAATALEIDLMREHCILISFCQPTRSLKIVKKLLEKKITAFSLHLVPRISLAQKMDALSSQSNIAGYKAVIIGAAHLSKYLPFLMTAAGTIPPAKVLIIGAGVAGLQAVATAKRLGAQASVFDVRPIVKEQVESLGAKFIEVSTSVDDGTGEGGYAKETNEEYKQRQHELIKQQLTKTDLVITTALIPGKDAPIIITEDMIELMQKGSVIMDLAIENGGNCVATQPEKLVEKNGVIIDGNINLPSTMPLHASQLYARNISSFLLHLFDNGKLNLDWNDEIISKSSYTHDGLVVNDETKQALNELY